MHAVNAQQGVHANGRGLEKHVEVAPCESAPPFLHNVGVDEAGSQINQNVETNTINIVTFGFSTFARLTLACGRVAGKR